MSLTVDDEIAAMRRRWPNFKATAASDILVSFRGALAPLRQAYEVRILHSPRFFLGGLSLWNHRPRVEVISPPLLARHPRTGQPVQHVYENEDIPASPLLCLYDPVTDEWRPGHTAIADTIVPWTAHWLACYEGWLATGKWSGGGRHPTARSSRTSADGADDTATDRSPALPDQLASEIAGVIGTHGSCPILAHSATASRECLDTAERHFVYQELALAGLNDLGNQRSTADWSPRHAQRPL